ncbi:MAG: rRNA maturation RNase YbeY [Longimicrobiales bacterium]|nr:rRNA maturation RNase YbeY [Longimicrobiales bacterium]
MTRVKVQSLVVDGRGYEDLVDSAARHALADRGTGEDAELSITLLDDAAIRTLNRDHLAHDRPTDVLAFALHASGEPALGDIYIGWDQAVRQAHEEGVPVAEELARLTIHGTLHVLGFEHPESAEARAASEMYRLQERLVAELDLDLDAISGNHA